MALFTNIKKMLYYFPAERDVLSLSMSLVSTFYHLQMTTIARTEQGKALYNNRHKWKRLQLRFGKLP